MFAIIKSKSIMKKILGLLCIFMLASVYQCDDEPLEGEFITEDEAACELATLQTAELALEFLGADNDTFTAICTAYKEAIEAQILVCGDQNGSLQAIIDQLGDCSDSNIPNADSCVQAIANKNEAEEAFNNSTAQNYTETCNALKEAIETVISECGTTTELQNQLDGLGNCILSTNAQGLEGTWLLTAWIGTEAIDLNNDGTESTNFLEEMDCYNNERLVFENDNTGESISTSFAEIEIFLEVGSTNSVDYNVECIQEDETVDFTWSQTGDTVSITDVFGTNDWTLEGDTLSIVIPEGFSVINEEDASVNTIQDLTFVYTKQ